MATELLSSAEAGPWREDKVLPGDRGVSLHWLCDFVQDKLATVNEPRWLAIQQGDRARAHNEAGRWGRHDLPDMAVPEVPPDYSLNTHAIVSQFIIPLTQEIAGPLFALVPPEHRGPPTTFISHTWNSLLIGPSRQRIGTLDAVYQEKDEFVWIDFACYTQPPVASTDISADMFDIIENIGKVAVAVTPTPLYNRSWCLWELYSADAGGLPLDFRVCTGFRNDKIQSVNALYRSFSGVENARSINAQAEAQIRDAFIRRHGGLEEANKAVKAMLKRQLGARWHELQPDDGPLKFSADPWTADPDGTTLRAYEPYWEPGLMDCVIYGGTETVREVFDRAGVYTGQRETATLSLQTSDPANLRLIDALQNEDTASIMSVAYEPTVDLNGPLPFRGLSTFEIAPPLHFLTPWATQRTLDAVLLAGADANLPWAFPPETESTDATQRVGLVRALLNGIGDPTLAAWTPLMLAVMRGDAGICGWLIECGAQARFVCPQTGLTALHIATAMKRKDLVELLIQHGAAVDAPLVSAITALHIAAIVGDVESIALLLESGADKQLRDRTGLTALEWARRNDHAAAAEFLEKTTVTRYDALKRMFREQKPALTSSFVNSVLWALDRDPASVVSLTLSYEKPSQYNVEAKFDKSADGITATVRATEDDGRPFRRIVTHFSLVNEDWQAKVIEDWQRG